MKKTGFPQTGKVLPGFRQKAAAGQGASPLKYFVAGGFFYPRREKFCSTSAMERGLPRGIEA